MSRMRTFLNDPEALTVFDATDPDFYKGELSPQFERESGGGERPWFFQPADWAPVDPDWYGSLSGSLLRRLECYSIGFATREEAQNAADAWLAELHRRALRGDTETLW